MARAQGYGLRPHWAPAHTRVVCSSCPRRTAGLSVCQRPWCPRMRASACAAVRGAGGAPHCLGRALGSVFHGPPDRAQGLLFPRGLLSRAGGRAAETFPKCCPREDVPWSCSRPGCSEQQPCPVPPRTLGAGQARPAQGGTPPLELGRNLQQPLPPSSLRHGHTLPGAGRAGPPWFGLHGLFPWWLH